MISKNKFFSEIKGCLESGSENSFSEIVSWALLQLGFDNVSYIYIPYIPHETNSVFIYGNYSSEWIDFYKEKSLYRCDPVIERSSKSTSPFLWGGKKDDTGNDKNIFKMSSRYGIEKGFSIPVHEPGCAFGSLNLSTKHENLKFDKSIKSQEFHIYSLTKIIHIYRPKITTGTLYEELSNREKECLHWAAKGKTYLEISIILGITERTVKHHITRCMEKLDSVNSKQAMTKAIRLGWI